MGTIDDLLSGRRAAADGSPLALPTRSVMIKPSLIGAEADAIRALGMTGPIAVVSDPDTHRVLGGRVEAALRNLGPIIPVHLSAHPHADMAMAEGVAEAASGAKSIVAVGSGTINDLCKYVAAKHDIECAVFTTAPSMNGYTSVNSAITVDGHKKSLPTVAPVGVFMDLKVLSEAPERMIRSGLGDSVCRATVQADWLMAHIVNGSAYDATPFELLAPEEGALFENAAALLKGDLDVMGGLARTLTLSGMGMTICGGSFPASQGEHLISHYIEMMAPADTPASFHGEQIGVATLVMARLQERLLGGGKPRVSATTVSEADVLEHFGPAIGPACWQEFAKKRLDTAAAAQMNDRLADCWTDIVERVGAVCISSTAVEAALKVAGAPTRYDDIGLERDFFRQAVLYARTIRNRYTFLDLAADSGLLDAETLI